MWHYGGGQMQVLTVEERRREQFIRGLDGREGMPLVSFECVLEGIDVETLYLELLKNGHIPKKHKVWGIHGTEDRSPEEPRVAVAILSDDYAPIGKDLYGALSHSKIMSGDIFEPPTQAPDPSSHREG